MEKKNHKARQTKTKKSKEEEPRADWDIAQRLDRQTGNVQSLQFVEDYNGKDRQHARTDG